MNSHSINTKMVIITLFILVLLGTINATLFTVALPKISHDLMISPSQVSWIVVGYLMINSVGSITYGKLADRFRIKQLFTIAILLFVAGSLIGFSYASYGMVITARLLQASGGASFFALSMVTVTRMLEPDKRPGAFSIISASLAFGAGFGPLVGGGIANLLGWQYLFLLMVVAVVGIGLLKKYLPNEAKVDASIPYHFDFVGASLLFALVVSMLVGVTNNSIFFILTLILAFLCKIWMTKAKAPFIDMELFKNSRFLRFSLIGFSINFAQVGFLVILPMLLAKQNGLSPFFIGIMLFISSIFGVISSIVTGKVIHRLGSQKMIYLASILMIFGSLSLLLTQHAGVVFVTVSSIMMYMGYSALQVSLSVMVPQTVSPSKLGVSLGLYNMFNFVGMAFGPAVTSRLLEVTGSFSLIFCLIAVLITSHFWLVGKASIVRKLITEEVRK